MEKKPTGAGKSSFELIEPGKLFPALEMKEDAIFLDAACGRGAYSLEAARHLGPAGCIYAFDLWPEGIDSLQRQWAGGLSTVRLEARVADISRHIPLADASVDVCLLATVLHDLIQDGTDTGALTEIQRAIKPRGRLAVVEFKKIEGPPGPPLRIRISPEEVEERVQHYGFTLHRTLEIGPFNYLVLFDLQ